MEYDRIILEMLDRIKKLETEVELLKKGDNSAKETPTDGIRISKKYRKLTDALLNANAKTVTLTFDEIERIIEGTLPDSARIHRAFWANTMTHSIAHGWLAAGYKVVDADLTAERVVFEREKNEL